MSDDETVVRDVGNRRQLLVDDHLVQEVRGLKRVLNQVTKHPLNPLVVPEFPWEVKYHFTWDGGTVLYDDAAGLFRWVE